jgi:hypothetical protein
MHDSRLASHARSIVSSSLLVAPPCSHVQSPSKSIHAITEHGRVQCNHQPTTPPSHCLGIACTFEVGILRLGRSVGRANTHATVVCSSICFSIPNTAALSTPWLWQWLSPAGGRIRRARMHLHSSQGPGSPRDLHPDRWPAESRVAIVGPHRRFLSTAKGKRGRETASQPMSVPPRAPTVDSIN